MLKTPLINVMTKAVLKASKGVLRDFGEVDKLQVSKKGVANFVTDADTRTEKILIDELSYARKNFSFLTEETGEIDGEQEGDHLWIIDPIDGTTNFIHAIPYFCISVAAAKRHADGRIEPIAGVIYDPVHDELFVAEKDEGAYLNGHKIRVSRREEDVIFSSASPRAYRDNYEEVESTLHRVTSSGATVRCSGAAALDLAYIAAGRLDGVWYHSLKAWDMAAGMVLINEAGGLVTDIHGNPDAIASGSIIATNGVVQTSLSGMVQNKAA